jgi:hypothetical protein
MIPRSSQSSLSHCTTTRPGMLAGSSGTTRSRLALADDHAAAVLAEVARQAVDLAVEPDHGGARGCRGKPMPARASWSWSSSVCGKSPLA